jgi:hypothetical protein
VRNPFPQCAVSSTSGFRAVRRFPLAVIQEARKKVLALDVTRV